MQEEYKVGDLIDVRDGNGWVDPGEYYITRVHHNQDYVQVVWKHNTWWLLTMDVALVQQITIIGGE